MTPFRIRRFQGPDGSVRVMLLDEANRPEFWPNVYSTIEYQQTGKSPETIEKVLRAIAMARLAAEAMGRNLDADLTTGPILTHADAESLAPLLGLSLSGLLAAVERKRQSDSALSVEIVPIRAAKLERRIFARTRAERKAAAASEAERKPASSEEAASRIRWVASYLRWRLQVREGIAYREKRSLDFVAIATKGIARLIQLAPTVDSAVEDNERLEGYGEGIAELIEEAVLPDSPLNPFLDDRFLRARNYLIWRLYLDTGARRSEILKTQVEDIDWSGRKLTIWISKTVSRTVKISARTVSAFQDYIAVYSDVIPRRARQRGYLFVNRKGELLLTRGINRLFETIRQKVPGAPEFLTPHGLRRDWNDRLSRMIDDQPEAKRITPAEESEVRRRTMGWGKNSKMASRYNKRHTRKKADMIVEEMFSKKAKPANFNSSNEEQKNE